MLGKRLHDKYFMSLPTHLDYMLCIPGTSSVQANVIVGDSSDLTPVARITIEYFPAVFTQAQITPVLDVATRTLGEVLAKELMTTESN